MNEMKMPGKKTTITLTLGLLASIVMQAVSWGRTEQRRDTTEQDVVTLKKEVSAVEKAFLKFDRRLYRIELAAGVRKKDIEPLEEGD